jgi:hypothetical protein
MSNPESHLLSDFGGFLSLQAGDATATCRSKDIRFEVTCARVAQQKPRVSASGVLDEGSMTSHDVEVRCESDLGHQLDLSSNCLQRCKGDVTASLCSYSQSPQIEFFSRSNTARASCRTSKIAERVLLSYA